MVLGEYRNQEVISQDYYYPEVLLRFSFWFLYLWLKFNRGRRAHLKCQKSKYVTRSSRVQKYHYIFAISKSIAVI